MWVAYCHRRGTAIDIWKKGSWYEELFTVRPTRALDVSAQASDSPVAGTEVPPPGGELVCLFSCHGFYSPLSCTWWKWCLPANPFSVEHRFNVTVRRKYKTSYVQVAVSKEGFGFLCQPTHSAPRVHAGTGI